MSIDEFGREIYSKNRISFIVPQKYEIISRYLRKYYPNYFKVLRDFSYDTQSWGWYIYLDNKYVILKCEGAPPMIHDSNLELKLEFETKKQKRIALKFIVSTLRTYYDMCYPPNDKK